MELEYFIKFVCIIFIFQKLRHNLSMNQSIKQSMACEVSSVSGNKSFMTVSVCCKLLDLNLNPVTKDLKT